MNTLGEIIAHKRKETEERKALYPISALENCPFFDTPGRSMVKCLAASDIGIIAEFKRRSPSKGVINDTAHVEQVTQDYASAGAAGISVLTDLEFFGGTGDDMLKTTVLNNVPILRKDFIIDEFQIIESKAIGSDVILLIAEVLTAEEVKNLSGLARSVGLEVLMEVHSQDQLSKFCDTVDIVGVNNRDLHTFKTDVQTSVALAGIDLGVPMISESGISDPKTIRQLQELGFSGFLIGECFMRETDPGAAFKSMMYELQKDLIPC